MSPKKHEQIKNERPDDLVLQQSRGTDFDWTKYAHFLDQLCGDREYQKDAVLCAVGFYLGNKYASVRELAEENFDQNPKIQELHSGRENYIAQFEFPDKLCCTVDLATATGKSWVMYGIAQILLCENAVDQVLILVPSRTIEKQLKEKFIAFSTDRMLKRTLPTGSKYKNPHIIHADVSILPGDICVENCAAILEHVKNSSIYPSLRGVGQRTLIINDEAHHIISEEKFVTKWNQFIKNPEFNFKYIFNCTGTPYKGNDYFRDVIYRYSIRKAIDEGYIKDIRYLTEDEGGKYGGNKDKNSLVYAIHEENRNKYKEIKKPLTIFISHSIDHAEKYSREFGRFLVKKKGFSLEDVEKKIIVVSSRASHRDSVALLDRVDFPDCPVEFIFSVSMLTEGWDVKNVFQIVPHEEKAFNSKLLISQVLGRGLRIPEVYVGDKKGQPVVTVTNHDAWSRGITDYVDAVAEINYLASYPVIKKPDYHFDIYWADATKVIKESKKASEPGEIKLPKSFGFHHQIPAKMATFRHVSKQQTEAIVYDVDYEYCRVGDLAIQIFEKIKDYDKSSKTHYADETSVQNVKDIIKKELRKAGTKNEDLVSPENRQRALNAFNILYRKETGSSQVAIKYTQPIKKNTKEMQRVYVSIRSMDEYRAIVYEEHSANASGEADRIAIKRFFESPTRYNGCVISVGTAQYKCPQNIVHARQKSEIEFVKRLTSTENVKYFDAWVKLPDQGFYEIEYSYKPGTHSLTRFFNPDFLIKKGNLIAVIEIKQDGDTNEQNVAKNEFAEKYFADMNEKIGNEQRYFFSFLSPEDYTPFFEALKKGNIIKFISKLRADLLRKTTNRKSKTSN